MTKGQLKERLKALDMSINDYSKVTNISARLSSNYGEDDELPSYHEAFINLIEENRALKKSDLNEIKEFLKDINIRVEGFLENIENK
jgi:hypothetical protein